MSRAHIPADVIETTATLYQFVGAGSLTVGSTYLYGTDQDEAFNDWAYDLIVQNWGADPNHIELRGNCPFWWEDAEVIDVWSTYEREVIGYLKVKVVRRLPATASDRMAA